MIIQYSNICINTRTGTMQCGVYRPEESGRFPSIIFYSEIFQRTDPIERSAKIIASHGFVVIVPEIFYELNPIGTVLGYDDEGKNKGNQDKFTKPLEHHDADVEHIVEFIKIQEFCNQSIASMGVCIGGHLAYRAALNPSIKAAFCLYATDIHSNTLPCEEGNDTLSRTDQITAEMVLVWGKQDPHVPTEGRQLIYQKLIDNQCNFEWREVNAQHAFMRDEGERYDAALAIECYRMAISLFQRVL